MTTLRFEVAINSAKISCSLKIKGEEESPLAKHVLEIFLDHSSFTLFFRPTYLRDAEVERHNATVLYKKTETRYV